MNGPTRLKHDPAFARETGVRLDDPALEPAAADMTAMQMRLKAAMHGADVTLQSGARGPGMRAGRLVQWTVAAALGVAGHHFYLKQTAVPPAPVALPLWVVVETPPALPATPPLQPSPLPLVAPPAVARPPPKAKPPATTATPTPTGEPKAAPMPLSLVEQLRVYESGRTALAAANHAVAAREFARYLDAAPQGELWPEAAQALLQAYVGLQRWPDAEALATQLLEVPRLKTQQRALYRARAKARAATHQCSLAQSDAFRSATDSSARSAALEEVRKACTPAPF